MQRFNFVFVIVILSSCTMLTLSLSAQSIWLNQGAEKSIAIEILKPDFDGDDNFTFLSLALFLSGRFPLSENVNFVGELPFAHAGFDIEAYNFDTGEIYSKSETETVIGNPYFGLEIRKQDSPVFAELGGRLPLAPDDKFTATLVGALSDFDRCEAFSSELITLTGKVNYQQTAHQT